MQEDKNTKSGGEIETSDENSYKSEVRSSYRKYLSPKRKGSTNNSDTGDNAERGKSENESPSEPEIDSAAENAAISDRSRIVFSSAFRRMQQKAQVFSLESNTSVRNRLTHTLEVADTGRRIAQLAGKLLVDKNMLDSELLNTFIQVVENACLMHDIGNPPFGHFCELAIQQWFNDNWKNIYRISSNQNENNAVFGILENYILDFTKFDGNPQGLRIASKLQSSPTREGNKNVGLNLTYTQILAFSKYGGNSGEIRNAIADSGKQIDRGIYKKQGYFYSEEQIVEDARKYIKFPHKGRFPLSYLMEAADDISYCASDIEDGIEKGILTVSDFFKEFEDKFIKDGGSKATFDKLIETDSKDENVKFYSFKVKLTKHLIKTTATCYSERQDDVMKGEITEIFRDNSEEKKVLATLKYVAKKKLLISPEAQNNEIAGYKVIHGLLNGFGILLRCSQYEFKSLITYANDDNAVKFGYGLDLHWRVFNRLSKKYIAAYEFAVKNDLQGETDIVKIDQIEWFHRAHLIVDYIAGMTDHFAVETFQTFEGINIL